MSTQINDESRMPFGDFKGKMMRKVPAKHLHWHWIAGLRDDMECPVAAYIRRNIVMLRDEYGRGAW